jgi:transcriptional regulator of acetoin/glycerol metabolism
MAMTRVLEVTPNEEGDTPTRPPGMGTTPTLWSAASGRFQVVRLRAAIVARGWTVSEFAAVAGISRACMYNALRHQSVSDRTAVRVTRALASREPLHVVE